MFDREDRCRPRLVVARALRSISIAALDALRGPTEGWLRSLDVGHDDWLGDVLDADIGVDTRPRPQAAVAGAPACATAEASRR